MGADWLRRARRYHAYFLTTVVATEAIGAVAALLEVGERLAAWTGASADVLAVVVLPLLAALAFVSLQARRERRRRVRQEWRFIRANLELRQSAAAMERLARVDALTGLDNRRSWHEKLEQEWRRADRYGSAPSLIMLDLDHFKAVNDRAGHDAGDQLLAAVAEALRAALRQSDLIGRLGGDEFAVLLPEASVEEARIVAEKMRRHVATLHWGERWSGPPVTASVGVACGRSGRALDAMGLLRQADLALYEAKHAGRNRVVAADMDDAQALSA